MARSALIENEIVEVDAPPPNVFSELEELTSVETKDGRRYLVKGTNTKRVPVYDRQGFVSLVDPENLEYQLSLRDRDTDELLFTREPSEDFIRNRPQFVDCPFCPHKEPVMLRVNNEALERFGFAPPDRKQIERNTALIHIRVTHPQHFANLISSGQVTMAEAEALKKM